MTSNTSLISQGVVKNTLFEKNDIEKQYQYGKIVIENHENTKGLIIKKDNITIVVGEMIEICNSDRSLKIDGDLNIEVVGNVTISSDQNITLKSPDGNLWRLNSLSNCLFTGSPHTLCQTIKGESSNA